MVENQDGEEQVDHGNFDNIGENEEEFVEVNGINESLNGAENNIPNHPNNTGESNRIDDETRRQIIFFLGQSQALLETLQSNLTIIQRLLEVRKS